MKPSSVRFLSLLASLALLAATIFVYATLLSPGYQEINQLRGDYATKSELVDNQRAIVAEVKAAIDRYKTLSGLQENISLALPTDAGYAAIINQLNSLAQASGLFLESVGVNVLPFSQSAGGVAGKNVPVVGTIQLTLRLAGSYPAFKSFAQSLETNVRIMDIASLGVAGGASGQNYTYTMVVNTYYQKL